MPATVVVKLGIVGLTGLTLKMHADGADSALAVLDGGSATSANLTAGSNETDSYSASVTGLTGLYRARVFDSGGNQLAQGYAYMATTGTVFVVNSRKEAFLPDGLFAAEIRAAMGMASANLDTQLASILSGAGSGVNLSTETTLIESN